MNADEHSLGEQCVVPAGHMLRIDKGADERFGNDGVSDPQRREQDLVVFLATSRSFARVRLEGRRAFGANAPLMMAMRIRSHMRT